MNTCRMALETNGIDNVCTYSYSETLQTSQCSRNLADECNVVEYEGCPFRLHANPATTY